MQAPERVLQRLLAHVHLGGQWLFVEELEGTAQDEVLGELIIPVDAQHRLALHAVGVVRLHTGVDLRAGINDALVEDIDHTHGIVHAVVDVLGQRDAAGRDDHRPLGDIRCAEVNLCAVRTFVATAEQELVLLGHLLGNGLGGVVEGIEAVLVGDCIAAYPTAQVVAKRFGYREDDASLRDRESFDIVKLAVGIGTVVVVQAVQVHGAQQGRCLQVGFRKIGLIDACRVVLEFHVEAELLALR